MKTNAINIAGMANGRHGDIAQPKSLDRITESESRICETAAPAFLRRIAGREAGRSPAELTQDRMVAAERRQPQ